MTLGSRLHEILHWALLPIVAYHGQKCRTSWRPSMHIVFLVPFKISEASKDLYGKGPILKHFDKMKIIIVLASIGVLSC